MDATNAVQGDAGGGLGAWDFTLYSLDRWTQTGGPCWLATDPYRPGCVGYGDTQEQAGESIGRARRVWHCHGGPRLEPPTTHP